MHALPVRAAEAAPSAPLAVRAAEAALAVTRKRYFLLPLQIHLPSALAAAAQSPEDSKAETAPLVSSSSTSTTTDGQEAIVWLLTSLGRPDRIRRVVDSYDWSGQPVSLVLYEGDSRLADYLSQSWPPSWKLETVPMRGNGPTYNEILRRHPNECCYGFLADDAILDVPDMLSELEISASDWNIAYANDKHWGEKLPTMPCLGGELVRAVGYLAPAHLSHWAIDTAWGELGKRIGNLRYAEHLTYTHDNPVWGTAPDDATYRAARAASFEWQSLLRSWMVNDMPIAIESVKQAQHREAA